MQVLRVPGRCCIPVPAPVPHRYAFLGSFAETFISGWRCGSVVRPWVPSPAPVRPGQRLVHLKLDKPSFLQAFRALKASLPRPTLTVLLDVRLYVPSLALLLLSSAVTFTSLSHFLGPEALRATLACTSVWL
jgi:hypothetical protein